MEPYYPLHALVCEKCFLVQLQEYVSPDHIFREYAYFSSYSTSWVEHARLYCHMIKERLRLGPDSLVVELASNDGYLLQHFLPLGVPVLGIEPAANVAEAARKRGVPSLVEFFGDDAGRAARRRGQAADLIIGNNVLAQVPDLNDFVAGMKRLLEAGGRHHARVPASGAPDRREPVRHHLPRALLLLLVRDDRPAGQSCTASRSSTSRSSRRHGGSLRVYLAHAASSHVPSPRVSELLDHEIESGFCEIETYARFSEQVRRTKRNLLSFLIACKEQGKTICAYGAPGKGNTLLNYCGIGPDFIDFAVDRNPYKHGRFTPGMHIPIKPVEAIDEAKPDYLLVLPWNLKDEIVHQMRHVGEWGCRFIIPIPEVHVIDPARGVS